jgi:hypothetical protein
MSRVTVPPLTPEIVMAAAEWHPRYAEILAIASDGIYGVSVVDGNSDRADIDVGIWRFEDGSWREHSSWGAFGEPVVEAWTSGWGGTPGAACAIHGYAPDLSSMDITLAGVVHRVAVGGNGYWAFIKATRDWPDDEVTEPASRERVLYADDFLLDETGRDAD